MNDCTSSWPLEVSDRVHARREPASVRDLAARPTTVLCSATAPACAPGRVVSWSGRPGEPRIEETVKALLEQVEDVAGGECEQLEPEHDVDGMEGARTG